MAIPPFLARRPWKQNMRISLVSDSPSLQWIIGRVLNEAGVTREPSEHVVSNHMSLDHENWIVPPDLVLFAAENLRPDSSSIRKLRQICEQFQVWIVYAGLAQSLTGVQLNCSAPLIQLQDFDATFIQENLPRRTALTSR